MVLSERISIWICSKVDSMTPKYLVFLFHPTSGETKKRGILASPRCARESASANCDGRRQTKEQIEGTYTRPRTPGETPKRAIQHNHRDPPDPRRNLKNNTAIITTQTPGPPTNQEATTFRTDQCRGCLDSSGVRGCSGLPFDSSGVRGS